MTPIVQVAPMMPMVPKAPVVPMVLMAPMPRMVPVLFIVMRVLTVPMLDAHGAYRVHSTYDARRGGGERYIY